MTLFDPSVSVFVGDDKYTGGGGDYQSLERDQSGAHYEVPVHVILPYEMCSALHYGKDSRYLEDLQLRLGNDVYTISGKNVLEARLNDQDIITLKQHQHVNMLDSSRPPKYNNLEIDVSYVIDAVSHTLPEGDIKAPLIIRVPATVPTDFSQIEVTSPRDAADQQTSRTDLRPTSRYSMPQSQYAHQYTPRDGPDKAIPDLFANPDETVESRARVLLGGGAIPDDVSGIAHYRPPRSDKSATHNDKFKSSSRSVYSNSSANHRRPPRGPSSRYGGSTVGSLVNSRVGTRRTNYSEPVYRHRQPQHPSWPEEDEEGEDDSPLNGFYSEGADRYRAPHQRRVQKSKTITFFRNGDGDFPGYTTSVSTRDFKSWETLLVFLSDKISLPYGVRYVYTLGGRSIQSINDMEDGQAYVCASGQFVPNTQFGNSRELKYRHHTRKKSGGKSRRTDKVLYTEVDELNQGGERVMTAKYQRAPTANQNGAYRRDDVTNGVNNRDAQPMVITVVSNTHRESRAKVILNPRTRQTFEAVLEDMGSSIVMTQPPVRKLFSARTGERVKSFSEMFGKFKNHDTFIACGIEPFKGHTNGAVKLPPTIFEGEQPSMSQKRPPPSRINKSGVRRPLQTIQRQAGPERKAGRAVDPLDLTFVQGGPGENMDTGVFVLDGEAERRRLFQDDGVDDDPTGGVMSDDDVTLQNYVQNGQTAAPLSTAGGPRHKNDSITVQIHGKVRSFVVPTKYLDEDWEAPINKPSKKLTLEWVYGYRGFDSRLNLYSLPSGELCYYVGAVAVLYDKRVEVQRHYIAHNEDISSMAVHPSGTLIATGQKRGSERANAAHIRVWDTDSLSTHAILGLSDFDGAVACLAFSSVNNGEWLMSVDGGDNHVMTVWEWEKEAVIARTKTCVETVVVGTFHPNDDRTLVTGGKQHLHFWRIISGKILRDKKSGLFVDEIPHYITCLVFNSDGEVVTGDSSGNIILWGKDKRNIYFVKHTIIRAHEKSIFSLCLLSDGTLISGGGLDRRIIAWDALQNYRSAKAGRQLPESIGGVRTLVTATTGGADGVLIVGTTKNAILEGSLQQKFTSIVQGHYDEIWALATHPSEEFLVSAGFDQQVCMWNSTTHKLVWKVFTEKPCLTCVFHPAGTVVGVGQSSGRFAVLNAYSGIHVTSFHVTTEQIDVAKISPDGATLAVGCHDKNIYIFDIQDNGLSYRRSGVMSGHNSFITQLDWSVDSNYLQSVSGNYNLLFWDRGNLRPEAAQAMRDCVWETHSSVLGFHVAGVWPALPKATDLNICAQAKSRQLVVSGDSRGSIRMFNFPASHKKCYFSEQKMCSSNVTQLEFMCDDRSLVATGGPDACLFQYNLTDS